MTLNKLGMDNQVCMDKNVLFITVELNCPVWIRWNAGFMENSYAYHGENKSFGDLLCQISIKEDDHVSHEYFELDDSNLVGRNTNIINFRWIIAQVVKKRPSKIVLLKGFKIFFFELFIHEGVKEYYKYQLLHLNFDGHGKYILSMH